MKTIAKTRIAIEKKIAKLTDVLYLVCWPEGSK